MDPTKPYQNLTRIAAALTLCLMVASTANAQLALPTPDLPALPGISAGADAPGASLSANAEGRSVGACYDLDPSAISNTATGALPAQASQVTGLATGAASSATGLLPVGLPSASDLPTSDCLNVNADDPTQAVDDVKGKVGEHKNFFERMISKLFGGF